MALFDQLISFGKLGVEIASIFDSPGGSTTLLGAPSTTGFQKLFGLDTRSGADFGRLVISATPGINPTRGGFLSLGGAQNANPDTLLSSPGANVFRTGGTTKWQVTLGGNLVNDATNGSNLAFARPSTGLSFTPGAGQRAGTTAAMTAGSITVANTTVTANTRVLYNRKTSGGTVGNLSCSVSAGVSFTITSSSGTETSTFDYMLIEVA